MSIPSSEYIFFIVLSFFACIWETKLLQFTDDTTAILADLNSAQALLKLLNDFEKVSGLKLNVMKTEAMWIGSLQNCEDEPLGFKWKTCVKFWAFSLHTM